MPPVIYYPKRAINFLYEGGLLCVVVGGKNDIEVKKSLRDDERVEYLYEIKINSSDDYRVLIYKKI